MDSERKHFDEMLLGSDGVRAPYAEYQKWFSQEDPARLAKKSKEAEAFFAAQALLLTSMANQQPKNG